MNILKIIFKKMVKFDIYKYIDSLPDDIDEIDVSFKKLNYLPDLSRFKKLETLFCYNNKLTSLPVLPENLKMLYCHFNELTLLPNLPENLKVLNCKYNKLTSLPVLPENLETLNCSNNNLTSLPILPENLKILYCCFNKLTSLPVLPENLETLNCSNNNLTSLPILPENLKLLNCCFNKLTSLPILPEYLERLYCYNNKLRSLPVLLENLIELLYYNNPIYDIIKNNNLNIKKNIKTWNNFRYLYYCLKYRKRFLRMMEPVIKKRYHPSYLYDLKEDDDLDEKLGAW